MNNISKKICITGAWYSSRNVGDQAILITISDLIKKFIPDAKFAVFTSNPEFIIREYGFESISPKRQPLRMLLTLARSDLLIIGGGTPFYDDLIHMLYFSFLVVAAKVFKTRTMVYAVSSRHLETRAGKFLTKFILNNADFVTIREHESLLRMRSLGLKKELHLTPDPAITLTPVEDNVLEKILDREGLGRLKKPVIGICLRNFITKGKFRVHHYKQFDDNNVENFKNVLAQIADHLTTVGSVVFIPMHTIEPDDDRVIAQEVINRMKNGSKVRKIDQQYRPQELIGLLSSLDLVVSARLHSLVLGSAVHVPVVGIGYGHKTKGFMDCIGQGSYYFDLESLNVPDLLLSVKDALSKKALIREDLEQRVNKLQELALNNAEIAVKLIYEGNMNV